MSVVPEGEIGELYIGGAGVSRGYLNQPELTTKKFITNPFSQQPGARMYKTGDLCRLLPGGAIEYIGRIDHQVKIRGYRIELKEIETVLSLHPYVKEAVVIVYEDELKNKQLVAYWKPHKKNQTGSVKEFQKYLNTKLPDYMIPAAFVCMEQFPLTPNGKLDRNALPLPNKNNYSVQAYHAPMNAREALIIKTWEELLHLKPIGNEDNFFSMEGKTDI